MNEEKRLKKVLSSGNIDTINQLFDELYNRYKGLVCFVIAKYVKNNDDVLDIAQEVFLSFFNNANKVNSSVKQYLTTIAKNMSLNFLKKNNKITYVDSDEIERIMENDNNSSINNCDFAYHLSQLKKSLSKEEYEILSMHLFDNYTFKAISIKLNIKESTIKTLYYRTIKKCKIIMKGVNNNEKNRN